MSPQNFPEADFREKDPATNALAAEVLPRPPTVRHDAGVVGVGIDLESVARLKAAAERNGDAFMEKVFAPREIEVCHSRGAHAWESFAARWAAKEAFSKALGTGIGGSVALTDFIVVAGNNGEPVAEVSPRGKAAMAKISATNALVSLSHTKEFAAAIVLLTR